jgi:hypothetical protein
LKFFKGVGCIGSRLFFFSQERRVFAAIEVCRGLSNPLR